MENEPNKTSGPAVDITAPFLGKCGKALQFILIGSLAFNLLAIIFALAEVDDATLVSIFLMAASLCSAYGYYTLGTTSQLVSLRRAGIILAISEALIAIGIIMAKMAIESPFGIFGALDETYLILAGVLLSVIGSAILLGDTKVVGSMKDWTVVLGTMRILVMMVLIWLFLKIFDGEPKPVVTFTCIFNFAITYMMWMAVLAPAQFFIKKK